MVSQMMRGLFTCCVLLQLLASYKSSHSDLQTGCGFLAPVAESDALKLKLTRMVTSTTPQQIKPEQATAAPAATQPQVAAPAATQPTCSKDCACRAGCILVPATIVGGCWCINNGLAVGTLGALAGGLFGALSECIYTMDQTLTNSFDNCERQRESLDRSPPLTNESG